MSNATRSVELLRIIADTVGLDRTAIDAGGEAEATEAHHRAVLLFRMIRAFRALPDAASRLHVLQYIEALAAQPPQPR